MQKHLFQLPESWLAFELNILRRLEFDSVAIPFAHNSQLGYALKQWNNRVLANDILQSAYADLASNIENNGETLTEDQIDLVLEDVYVPQYRLRNPALTNWFNETDSWWFDNVRQNIERLTTPLAQAAAITIGLRVGDYLLSFDDLTIELRQPLSNVFRRFAGIFNAPVNNGQNNTCQNKSPSEFIAENYTDLLFLKLPRAHKQTLKESLGWKAWREEWVRGEDSFWPGLEARQRGKLGTHVETKTQYLSLIVELFKTAQHIDLWAVEHIEDGFIHTQDIVEAINEVRRVDTIFSKDFSELMGTKTSIVTA